MASDSDTSCVGDPNFAVICSFLDKFGALLGLTCPDYVELQDMLENTQELAPELIEIHLKLLRRIKKSVSLDRWERVLVKLCHTFSSQDAWELERFGYKKARTSSKVRILKNLMEMQFDYHQKFKAEINNQTPEQLRTEPLGRDKNGLSYWCLIDEQCNIRVYREDPDEESFVLIAKDREGLVHLITQLSSGEIDAKDLDSNLQSNEDSNSLEIEKPITDTGQITTSTSPSCVGDESSVGVDTIEKDGTDTIEKDGGDTIEKDGVDTIEKDSNIIKPSEEILDKKEENLSHKEEPKETDQTPLEDSNCLSAPADTKALEEDKIPEFKKIRIAVKPFGKLMDPVGINLSASNKPSPVNKGIDLTNKKKKSINDLLTNLRNKSQDKPRPNVQEQELDVRLKKSRMDSNFSSLSEPPFEPITIESALRLATGYPGSDEDEDFDEDEEEEISLPSHMKHPRLDRPTLLTKKVNKSFSDADEEEFGDEIEEPVMFVRGEGSGKECNSGNVAITEEDEEYGEAVEEEVMYFYGEGSGQDCEAGNHEEKEKETTEKKTHSETENQQDTHSSHLETETNANKSDIPPLDISESKTVEELNTVLSPNSKIGKVIFDSDSKIEKPEKLPCKKSSRWDVKSESKVSESDRPTVSPNSDLNIIDSDASVTIHNITSEDNNTVKTEINVDTVCEDKNTDNSEDYVETSSKVKNLIYKWENASLPSTPTIEKTETITPKKQLFFFGPNSLKNTPFFQKEIKSEQPISKIESTSETELKDNSKDTSKQVPTNVNKADNIDDNKIIPIKDDSLINSSEECNISLDTKINSKDTLNESPETEIEQKEEDKLNITADTSKVESDLRKDEKCSVGSNIFTKSQMDIPDTTSKNLELENDVLPHDKIESSLNVESLDNMHIKNTTSDNKSVQISKISDSSAKTEKVSCIPEVTTTTSEHKTEIKLDENISNEVTNSEVLLDKQNVCASVEVENKINLDDNIGKVIEDVQVSSKESVDSILDVTTKSTSQVLLDLNEKSIKEEKCVTTTDALLSDIEKLCADEKDELVEDSASLNTETLIGDVEKLAGELKETDKNNQIKKMEIEVSKQLECVSHETENLNLKENINNEKTEVTSVVEECEEKNITEEPTLSENIQILNNDDKESEKFGTLQKPTRDENEKVESFHEEEDSNKSQMETVTDKVEDSFTENIQVKTLIECKQAAVVETETLKTKVGSVEEKSTITKEHDPLEKESSYVIDGKQIVEDKMSTNRENKKQTEITEDRIKYELQYDKEKAIDITNKNTQNIEDSSNKVVHSPDTVTSSVENESIVEQFSKESSQKEEKSDTVSAQRCEISYDYTRSKDNTNESTKIENNMDAEIKNDFVSSTSASFAEEKSKSLLHENAVIDENVENENILKTENDGTPKSKTITVTNEAQEEVKSQNKEKTQNEPIEILDSFSKNNAQKDEHVEKKEEIVLKEHIEISTEKESLDIDDKKDVSQLEIVKESKNAPITEKHSKTENISKEIETCPINIEEKTEVNQELINKDPIQHYVENTEVRSETQESETETLDSAKNESLENQIITDEEEQKHSEVNETLSLTNVILPGDIKTKEIENNILNTDDKQSSPEVIADKSKTFDKSKVSKLSKNVSNTETKLSESEKNIEDVSSEPTENTPVEEIKQLDDFKTDKNVTESDSKLSIDAIIESPVLHINEKQKETENDEREFHATSVESEPTFEIKEPKFEQKFNEESNEDVKVESNTCEKDNEVCVNQDISLTKTKSASIDEVEDICQNQQNLKPSLNLTPVEDNNSENIKNTEDSTTVIPLVSEVDKHETEKPSDKHSSNVSITGTIEDRKQIDNSNMPSKIEEIVNKITEDKMDVSKVCDLSTNNSDVKEEAAINPPTEIEGTVKEDKTESLSNTAVSEPTDIKPQVTQTIETICKEKPVDSIVVEKIEQKNIAEEVVVTNIELHADTANILITTCKESEPLSLNDKELKTSETVHVTSKTEQSVNVTENVPQKDNESKDLESPKTEKLTDGEASEKTIESHFDADKININEEKKEQSQLITNAENKKIESVSEKSKSEKPVINIADLESETVEKVTEDTSSLSADVKVNITEESLVTTEPKHEKDNNSTTEKTEEIPTNSNNLDTGPTEKNTKDCTAVVKTCVSNQSESISELDKLSKKNTITSDKDVNSANPVTNETRGTTDANSKHSIEKNIEKPHDEDEQPKNKKIIIAAKKNVNVGGKKFGKKGSISEIKKTLKTTKDEEKIPDKSEDRETLKKEEKLDELSKSFSKDNRKNTKIIVTESSIHTNDTSNKGPKSSEIQILKVKPAITITKLTSNKVDDKSEVHQQDSPARQIKFTRSQNKLNRKPSELTNLVNKVELIKEVTIEKIPPKAFLKKEEIQLKADKLIMDKKLPTGRQLRSTQKKEDNSLDAIKHLKGITIKKVVDEKPKTQSKIESRKEKNIFDSIKQNKGSIAKKGNKEKKEEIKSVKKFLPDTDPKEYTSDSDTSLAGFADDVPEIIPSDDELKISKETKPLPSIEVRPVTKPLLTVVDITKLQRKIESPPPVVKQKEKKISEDPSICIINDDSNDVVNIPDTDPLACTEEVVEPPKPPSSITLATFKLDTEDTEETPPEPVRRNLRRRQINYIPPEPVVRKRAREPEPTIIIEATNAKKAKTRNKRPVDKKLRKSIEEQKRKEANSSEDEEEEEKEKEKEKTTPKVAKSKKGKAAEQNESPKTAIPKGKKTKEKKVAKKIEKRTESNAQDSDAPPSDNSRSDTTATPTSVTKKSSAKKPGVKFSRILGLDINPSAIIPQGANQTGRSLRHSGRIAQQKIKEEADRRKIEDIHLSHRKTGQKKKKIKKEDDKAFKTDKKKKKSKHVSEEEESEEEEEDDDTCDSKKHKKKRKHQDLRRLFNMSNPWKSSSDSSEQEEEEEEIEEEISEEEPGALKSDHEFSPESDIENANEVQPTRRARTVKKESDTEDPTDDHACQKCGKSDHPEWILLCDTCDCGWHCSCLRPALLGIPEGDWFCPPCQHASLISSLKDQLTEYDKRMNRLEMEVRRKERLAYVGISLDNVLPCKDKDDSHEMGADDSKASDNDSRDSESSSGTSTSDDSDEPIYQLRERRQAHSYRFNDYDELINSAIQDEIEAGQGAGNQGRGKDISTIVNAEKEEGKEQVPEVQQTEELPPVVPVQQDVVKAKSDEDESEEELRVVPKQRGRGYRKRHRKLNALDVDSADTDQSDEDFKGDSGSEEEDFEEDLGSYDSEDSNIRGRGRRGEPIRRSTRARITRYDREFINDNSEDDDIPRKKRSRSMWDESESEESDTSWGRKGKSKKRQFPSTTRSHKKSKKKKKRLDLDGDHEIKPKVKKPRIKYGGLDDSDDEVLSRRTRGKKITYIDTLGSDSEEEKVKKTARIIESEEEYVANEEDEDEEAVEETGEDKPESEEVEAESAEETTPPVVTKKVIKLPILAKIPKSPRARGRGRGKGGIQRNPKLIVKPPVKPPDITPPSPKEELIVKEQASPAKDQELEVEEQSAIPAIAANPDSLEEEEAEMMMEDEEYANKQLKLMAIQLAKEKEKKRKEFEAVVQAEAEKQVTPIVEEKTLIQTEAQKVELPTPVDIISQVDKTVSQVEKPEPKKRGRRKKYVEGASPLKQQLQQTQVVPPIIINKALLQASMANTNTSDQEKPICSIENSSVPTVIQDLAVTPPKRRGRGKGKKTIAAEQAAAAAAAAATSGETSNTSITANSENSASGDSQTNVTSSSPEPNFPGGKLGIAAPPQPFSQNQPTPSVITRMLQSQPMTNQPFTTAANAMNQKYFGGMNIDQPRGTVPSQFPGMTPRGRVPSPYKQNVPPGVNHYPGVRNTLAPGSPHRLRSPGPPNLPQMFHSSHHPLDPSPSGGGHVTTTPRDRQSPGDVTMTTKGGPTPPPPPQYSRASMSGPAPTTSRFPNPNETAPGPSSSSPARPHHMPFPSTGNHMQPASPPRPPAGGGNFSPYHPPPPPNYHYGAYPPPPSLAAADDAMPPTVYQSSPYPEHYNPADGGAGAHTSEGSNSKPFDEEGSGEFGGLVSYFSSQREDDLDA